MKIGNLLTEASESIIINKGRSLLTVLGIVIGIAAVTTIMGLGAGMDAKIDKEVVLFNQLSIEAKNQMFWYLPDETKQLISRQK